MANQRKKAFQKGLATITRPRRRGVGRPSDKIRGKGAFPYNARSMLTPNAIHTGDSIKLLNSHEPEWVDLVFADPPFNIGYLYHGYDDKLKTDDYLQFSRDWMKAVHRALKPNGSFYLAIGDDYAADLCVIARRELGFNMRNWIIWHYTFGQQTRTKFARSHTHILYFTKDEKNFTFNRDAIRVASARQTTYGDKRASSGGKTPDDVWLLRPQEAPEEAFATDSDTWFVSRLCGTFKEREGWHGCQMPMDVLNRIVKASSNPGDIVLDPFNGSGTTVVSAALLDRQYVGIDQSAEYVGYAQKRLAHALEHKNNTPAALDPKRDSRVQTATDAFGRERVKRRSRKATTA